MIVKANNVTIEYGNFKALENINLEINEGDFVYFLGPNGGGKTTLVKAIANILKPSSGELEVNTNDIGYLPQNLKINKNFPASVFEIIYSGFYKQRLFPTKEQKQVIDNLLINMEILDLKNKLIGELSGGQLQRVLLCRSLVNNPKLLILDEPTSAIDVNFKNILFEYIEKLNKEKNITIIIITHDLSGIDYVECKDKVYYIDKTIKYKGRFCDYHKEFLGREKHEPSRHI